MSIQTLLIGLDGATFTVLDPLMAEGVMPFLASFLASGVRAPLRTIIPALTPPAWTSLMTGRRPGNHGVFDFFQMDSGQSSHIRFFTSNDIHCDTIWSLASGQGLRTTVLNFPAMFPAPRINGTVIPGWIPWRQLRSACWPEDLFDRLKTLPGFNPKELAMDIKLEERATEGCSNPEEFAPWIELHIRREENWLEIVRSLTLMDPSPLTAVLFDGVDKLQHLCWPFIHPEPDTPLTTEWEHRIAALCRQYFRKLDAIIEELCTLAGPEATVILSSDHGFGPTRDVLNVNAWLERKGYLAWSAAAVPEAKSKAILGVGQVARHTWMLDWTRTKAFAATPTSNGIFIVRPDAMTDAEYQQLRSEIAAELFEIKNEQGLPVVREVWTREQVFPGAYGQNGPDLTIVNHDGGLISILPASSDVSRRDMLAGAHRPLGIFAARGPSILPGAVAEELSILDVAPLILHSLDLPVPQEMEGAVPAGIFCPGELARRPVRYSVPEHRVKAAAVVSGDAAALSPGDEAIVLDRLRELGYID